jgi:hypothetical protein
MQKLGRAIACNPETRQGADPGLARGFRERAGLAPGPGGGICMRLQAVEGWLRKFDTGFAQWSLNQPEQWGLLNLNMLGK